MGATPGPAKIAKAQGYGIRMLRAQEFHDVVVAAVPRPPPPPAPRHVAPREQPPLPRSFNPTHVRLKCPAGHEKRVSIAFAGLGVPCDLCAHVWQIPTWPPDRAPWVGARLQRVVRETFGGATL